MIINLSYNEFIKKYELNIIHKIGFIQEKILNLNNLLIYNIEYSKIKIKNNYYILGSEDLLFNLILKDFLDKYNLIESDIEEIIIYDRKRDENGNVIKENIIIDKYNEWFINNENENYLNYIENNNPYNNFENNNSHIIRFPIDVILRNILRMPFNNNELPILNSTELNNELDSTLDNGLDDTLNDTLDDTLEGELNNSDNNEINNSANNEINNSDNNQINNLESNETNNLESNERLENYLRNGYIQNLNELINSFDNIIQRNSSINNRFPTSYEYVSFPIFENLSNNLLNEYDDLPDLIDDNNNIFNYININQAYEDIKVVLTEEQFNNQKHYFFKELKCNDLKECLICIQDFNDDDEVTKITCNHIFHKKCIKNWVCEESNKCPICRLEVDKGIAK